MASETEILVVGAGPTGLTLALQARLMGGEVRVIERRLEPRPWAPALAVHPRTMELLRGLGVAEELLARGVSDVGLHVHVGSWSIEGRLHRLHLPVTEYPFVLFVPQPEVETVLRDRLTELGVEVEWGTEITGFAQDEHRVECQVDRMGRGGDEIAAAFVAGCDGSESTVRDLAGIRFRGRHYRQRIVVADAEPTDDLPNGSAHAFVRRDGILFVFPLPSGRWRIIAPDRGIRPLDLNELVARHSAGQVRLNEVDWVTSVQPQHRLAGSYRRGRVFLAGDAAHVHSPAGAQGLNTGIGDGVNLGWKLASALNGAPDALLASYETERRPVARHVVRLTGVAFALEVSDALPLRVGRRWVARPVASFLLPLPGLVSIAARVLSGLDTRYRTGARDTSDWHLRAFRPGNRLPDFETVAEPLPRLHRLIDGRGFHLLVFNGQVMDGMIDELTRDFPGVTVDRCCTASLSRVAQMAAYVLVRPDGHIAVAGDDIDADRARQYLEQWIGPSARHAAREASRVGQGRGDR